MQLVQGGKQCQCDLNDFGDGERTTFDPFRQCLPLKELHGDEVPALMLTYLVNRADIGMIEGGGGPCLTPKALERFGVVGQLLWRKLQCHEAAEVEVLSLVHHPHAAGAQHLDNAEMGKGLANHPRGPSLMRWAEMVGGITPRVNGAAR